MFERCQYCPGSLYLNHSARLIRGTCELPVKIMLELISWSKNRPETTSRNLSFIEKMPNEILVKIFQYCDDADFANLRLQCTRFDQVTAFMLITTCGILLAKRYQQRLVTCLTITYNASNDTFVLATFKKSHSNKQNSIEVSRANVLRGCYHNLRYCFRRFRVLGLQFSNLFLCSRTLRYFCDLLTCCAALEPKTLRLYDCYVADLQHDALMRLMNLCSKYLIVLSFINLAGVRPSLFQDDLFQTINRRTLYVLMIQAIDFHISVPTIEQQLPLSDSILLCLPSTMRKIKLEKCQNITAEGICDYIERYFNSNEHIIKVHHRSTEMVFRQCKQLTTAAFEKAAQLRHICIDGQDPDGEYIMNWVKRRQYHLRHINRKKLIAIEIDSHQLITRSGLSSPITIEELSRNSMHSVQFLSICHLHSSAAEQILTPAINSARMARKWNREQDYNMVRTDKRYPKALEEPSVFLQPIIKTASIIRRVSYTSHIPNRFSFPR
uniref:F-box domain-containing protein n=1 Tax=Elaeophora elaphi TaxID=1147741 RepID=A0A0R3RQM3_9BILA